MCEFCNNPAARGDRDATHIEFAGFFSDEAINAAVQQVQQQHAGDDTASDDGT